MEVVTVIVYGNATKHVNQGMVQIVLVQEYQHCRRLKVINLNWLHQTKAVQVSKHVEYKSRKMKMMVGIQIATQWQKDSVTIHKYTKYS